MTSLLIITPVDKVQSAINAVVKFFKDTQGIYVSLNKPHKTVEQNLKRIGLDTKKTFFIDCVSTIEAEDVLQVKPDNLEFLQTSIITFIDKIEGRKFIIIDGLSTLLIYNAENKVAKFVQKITEYASRAKVEVIAFSPQTTTGEGLLTKIFNFFDKVKGKPV